MKKIIRTVLGDIDAKEAGVTLPHEHIIVAFDPFLDMSGKKYLDKEEVLGLAVKFLNGMKEKYGLRTFVDCTPSNIGRDTELLRAVARGTGLNVVCSSGLYWTEECMIYSCDADEIAERIEDDVRDKNAGLLKFATENGFTPYLERLFEAICKVQVRTGLPICAHTDARRKLGRDVLSRALKYGVDPERLTIAHCSDTTDGEYLTELAAAGCYVAFDRLYGSPDEDYIAEKCDSVEMLADKGFADRILLSHDAFFFCGFSPRAAVVPEPRFPYVFDSILPALAKRGFSERELRRLVADNPAAMLACEK